jgi:MATE family multidrug resistance protein
MQNHEYFLTVMQLQQSLHQRIWTLAWPMILANISVPLLGLVDAAILGHLDQARYLAAVAIGGSILSFVYWGFGFIRMGTTGLAAQAIGARQFDRNRTVLAQSMILGAAIGLLLILLSPLLIEVGIAALDPPAQARQLAYNYCQIRLFSAPAVLINFAIIGWLIGNQQTRWPLLITVFTNALNIGLDFVFILGLKLNSAGAAYATLLAEYSGCLLALWLLHQRSPGQPGKLLREQLQQWSAYRQLLQVNRQLFMRSLLLLGSFAFFTAQSAAQGETVLAANALLIQLLLLTSFGLDGIAHAAEALVGESMGQNSSTRFIQTCRACLIWSLAIAALYSLGFWVLQTPAIALLTKLPEVTASLLQSYPWVIALPLIAVWSYLLDGIFIGATQSRAMLHSMLLSVLLVYLPIWYTSQGLANHGLWLAFTAFNAARGLSLGGYFYYLTVKGRW